MIEHIVSGNELLAVIIRHDFSTPGIHFFTPSDFSQQLAYMHHPPGKIIPSHYHNELSREVHFTQEVLLIKRGKVRVDFYDNAQQYFESAILEGGDIVLLASGGHGFEVMDELEMIEVKQGPYTGDADKTRFPGITAQQVVLKKKQEDEHGE